MSTKAVVAASAQSRTMRFAFAVSILGLLIETLHEHVQLVADMFGDHGGKAIIAISLAFKVFRLITTTPLLKSPQ